MSIMSTIFLVVTCSLILGSFVSSTTESSKGNNQVPSTIKGSNDGSDIRQYLSTIPGGRKLGRAFRPGHKPSREELDVLRKTFESIDPSKWNLFATVKPQTDDEAPNCFVEVQVVQRVPGKCIKLGGRIPACQADDLVTLDSSYCSGM